MIKIIPFSQTRKNAVAPMDCCGNRAVAVIQSDACMIPMCENCLLELKKECNNIKFTEDGYMYTMKG